MSDPKTAIGFKEKCGGREHHLLGHNTMINGRCYLVVYGRVTKRVTKSGREVWVIPRPHEAPREADWDHGEMPWEPGSRRRPGSAYDAIPLPALVECWGCGWKGIIKPREKGPQGP